ncbi:MAG: hypothetical protein ABI758_00345 [Candidatus Woesebacteria bacterium]
MTPPKISWVRLLCMGLFLFGGLVSLLSGNIIAGLCLASIGFLISPYANTLFSRQFQKQLPVWGKIVLGILLFFGYTSTITPPKASQPGTPPTVRVEQMATVQPTPEPTFNPSVTSATQATITPTPSPTLLPSPTPTLVPTAAPTTRPTPRPTPFPTFKATPTPVMAAPVQTGGSWTCNCAKTCPQMSSCSEAQYQLNTCGCSARDADHDGIACDADCQ